MSRTSVQDHLAGAVGALRSGRSAEAKEHLRAVLALDPLQPAARNILGLEALRSGNPRAAAEHFEQACQGDPAATELWINLAAAYRSLQEDDLERAALERALATDQRDLMALLRLAELHERRGEEGRATERWSAVLALASAVDEPSAEFSELLAHARSYVDRRRLRLAEALNEALADELAAASVRDSRRVRAAADVMLGRRSVFTNECHGFRFPFLPADEFFDREHFPWLDTLEAATAEIREELEGILADPDADLAPYVDQPPGVPENKWSPLDKSLDWSVLHLWRDGERIDAACARAPRTAKLVEALPLCRIPGRAPAVFFSILRAGKHIPPHTGVTNVRSIVHLPLMVPEGCTFRVGGETRPWVEGEALIFDDTIEHEARNPTGRDRAVLILDCWNPYLSETERAMVCRLFAVSDAHKHG
jgi:aspartyl/asparaginyl beta-hydroxylase (cupin superfamily)/Tfp pilus assembly protein PilF